MINPLIKTAGFTLLEVMVALIVLAVGLLGMAGLQALGMRYGQSAYLRSQATALAYDLADRVRANPAAFVLATYNTGTAAQKTACLTTAGCSAADMAVHDLFEWNTALTNLLPLGRVLPSGEVQGVVCVDSTPSDGTPAATACDNTGSTYVIKLWWDDQRTGSSSTFQRLSVSFQP